MSVSNERSSPLAAVAGATFLGLAGVFLGVLLVGVAFGLLRAFVAVGRGSPLASALTLVMTGVSLVSVGAAYLRMRGLPASYVRFRWPSRRDVVWVVVGTVALFGVLTLLSFLIEYLGLSAASHSVAERGQENPALLLPLIPLSVLVTGPAEEFLYRGVIQTRLTEAFDAPVAVVVAGLLFSLVHVPAYGATSGLGWSLATTLTVLLILGTVLGAVYEYAGNLFVPAIVHGVYNAVVFGQVYVRAAGIL